MEAQTAVLLGASIAGLSGVAGQMVTGWLTRRRERDAWLRQERVNLYTQMLVWENSARLWVLRQHEWTQWEKGEGFKKSGLAHAPFPEPPSPEFEARARLIADPNVHSTWIKVQQMNRTRRALGDHIGLGDPNSAASDEARADFLRLLDRFVIATHSDATATGRGRAWMWRRRLLRRLRRAR